MTQAEIKDILQRSEDVTFEAKSARGGFPDSFWETYSSFANTDGGIILLGVKEERNHTLKVEGLSDMDKTKRDFWNLANNRQKISVNIVTDRMVYPAEIDGKHILVVEVPRAERSLRPIFKGLDPRTGSYRRNHEGDYLCTLEQVSAMFRDAANTTQDAKVLESMDFTVFCQDSIRSYRNVFRNTHVNHVWNNLDDEIFLRKLGAVAIGEDGKFHPTAAGLLMFGYEYEITREFPNYFLDYQENRSMGTTRWTDRIVSSSGEWSGNVFDFARQVSNRLTEGLKVPFVLRGFQRIDDTPLHHILREAVTNSVAHADFYGRRGVVIKRDAAGFEFANPGTMRVAIPEAIGGSVSDPRNGIILKMFSLLEFGERAGSGLNGIFKVWKHVFHTDAVIETQNEAVDRTTLILSCGGNEQDVKAMLELYDHADELTFDADEEAWKKMMAEMQGRLTQIKGTSSNNALPDAASMQLVGRFTENPTMFIEKMEKFSVNLHEFIEKYTENTPEFIEKLGEKQMALTIILMIKPEISTSMLSEIFGLSTRTVAKMLDKLKVAQIIRRVGPAKGGHWEIIQ